MKVEVLETIKSSKRKEIGDNNNDIIDNQKGSDNGNAPLMQQQIKPNYWMHKWSWSK